MGTLINNHSQIRTEKVRRPKVNQIDKLKAGLKTDDLLSISYTGECDASGGSCACGKKNIVYRFFVKNQQGEIFVVGSECINHFTQSVQNEIKSHDKQLKKRKKELKEAELNVLRKKVTAIYGNDLSRMRYLKKYRWNTVKELTAILGNANLPS